MGKWKKWDPLKKKWTPVKLEGQRKLAAAEVVATVQKYGYFYLFDGTAWIGGRRPLLDYALKSYQHGDHRRAMEAIRAADHCAKTAAWNQAHASGRPKNSRRRSPTPEDRAFDYCALDLDPGDRRTTGELITAAVTHGRLTREEADGINVGSLRRRLQRHRKKKAT